MVESPEEKALFMEVAGLPEEPSLTDRYVLSFYYINTVFTTVLSIFLSFYYINAVFTTVLSIFLVFLLHQHRFYYGAVYFVFSFRMRSNASARLSSHVDASLPIADTHAHNIHTHVYYTHTRIRSIGVCVYVDWGRNFVNLSILRARTHTHT